jgi:hypothetical protein
MPQNEALDLTVHALPIPQATQRRGRLTMALILVACLSPVAASYFLYFVIQPQARSNYARLIQPTRAMPDSLALRDLSGSAVSAKSLKGQWLLVVVAGSACDARCEHLLYEQRQLREMMGREKDRIDRVWLVADDAPVRQPLLKALQAGNAPTILRVSRAELTDWLAPEEGGSLEDSIYVVDPMGEWMMRTPAQPDPAKFKRDLDRLLRASAFWDRPGRGT